MPTQHGLMAASSHSQPHPSVLAPSAHSQCHSLLSLWGSLWSKSGQSRLFSCPAWNPTASVPLRKCHFCFPAPRAMVFLFSHLFSPAKHVCEFSQKLFPAVFVVFRGSERSRVCPIGARSLRFHTAFPTGTISGLGKAGAENNRRPVPSRKTELIQSVSEKCKTIPTTSTHHCDQAVGQVSTVEI